MQTPEQRGILEGQIKDIVERVLQPAKRTSGRVAFVKKSHVVEVIIIQLIGLGYPDVKDMKKTVEIFFG